MNPKGGNAGTPVKPAEPGKAVEADIADPGKVARLKAEQRKTQKGKYGAVSVQPHKPPRTDDEREQKHSWIEIVLVDEADNPVTGEGYRITLPDDSVAEGTLDEKGFARVDGIEPGTCQVSFPNLDKEVWERC